ncbi:hypothetical protein BD779DRAFT_661725 [Infundibulicybe gibba]|nr:hypothetical protein BD779DRAFT_661725 [Infundibulicybe gibba]
MSNNLSPILLGHLRRSLPTYSTHIDGKAPLPLSLPGPELSWHPMTTQGTGGAVSRSLSSGLGSALMLREETDSVRDAFEDEVDICDATMSLMGSQEDPEVILSVNGLKSCYLCDVLDTVSLPPISLIARNSEIQSGLVATAPRGPHAFAIYQRGYCSRVPKFAAQRLD